MSHLESIDHVVHSIIPDSFKISETNKPGMYPHPVAVCVGEHGKILVLDYAPKKNSSRLLEVMLHVPADVKILGEYLGATSMVYPGGIAYLSAPWYSNSSHSSKTKATRQRVEKGRSR